MQAFFLTQSQLQELLSPSGKRIHNYTINDMIKSGEFPEPTVTIGREKRWSINTICDRLNLTPEQIHEFFSKRKKNA